MSVALQTRRDFAAVRTSPRLQAATNFLFLFLLTTCAFIVAGYHPGLEDDSFYLAAIKRQLNPSLFPHDADFFRVQFQATIFDKLIALSVRLTHLPIAWATLLWQIAAIFVVLHGCWRLARRCFREPAAHWTATALVGALLTMPIGGIGINIADQYLHPRTIATALILEAIAEVVDARLWLAAFLLLLAFSVHAIHAAFGISFCIFLWWMLHSRQNSRFSAITLSLVPLGWIFEPASEAWRQAAATRDFYFLGRWHWYEWLGLVAPLLLIFVLHLFLRAGNVLKTTSLRPLVAALLYYGVFQTLVGLVIMLPPQLQRLRPFEPMRYLHLLYILFFVILGGLLGKYTLCRRPYRWAVFFVPLCASMFYAQCQMYSGSPHLELPFTKSTNSWVLAFEWIRLNTPVDVMFAIDPHYESLPGEDYHGFRGLAERSVLADYEKDAGMAARVPSLAPRWLNEVTALKGWRNFKPADFERLNQDFGVSWFVFSRFDDPFAYQQPDRFYCLYENEAVKVCHLGATVRKPPNKGLDEVNNSPGF